MTFEEAKDCEEKARRDLATFQEELQRSLLYIAGLTHRSRLADLNDDVFLFAKERYFIGEIVDAIIGGSRYNYNFYVVDKKYCVCYLVI